MRLGWTAWLALVALAGCRAAPKPLQLASQSDGTRIDSLWALRVAPQLALPLWRDDLTYEAGHMLMVPLHAAFALDRAAWRQQFSDHFRRAVDSGFAAGLTTDNAQDRTQYLYLASRFAVLATRSGHPELVPPRLTTLILRDVDQLWHRMPAWMWDRADFTGGIRARLAWKLSPDSMPRSYYRAVFDIESFLFAIAADLKQLDRQSSRPSSPTVDEILSFADRIFRARGAWAERGGWLFQPGVWRDHPDYEFVGHDRKQPGLRPSRVNGIAEDASHSHRMALWLTSLAEAYPPGGSERGFYLDLRAGFAKQFFRKVLVEPTRDFRGFRTKNFMDGRNGIYRWQYARRGDTWGYGPYELSGTLALGWWAFLGTEQSRSLYARMAALYPLEERVALLYLAPAGRTLPPERDWYFNGLGEVIALLASRLGPESTQP